MKMTDLVVQCTFDQGEEGGGIIILWIGTPGVELRIPSDRCDYGIFRFQIFHSSRYLCGLT